ncbi:hypothetical protein [Natranaerofaba carboxydovora]|uniref:hypothetical protein n=1 Tax=Natranaerofaba carboxydovora TaxID=2742683 RepID=UPI001F13B4A6|nr:hypothetical protein [Natranaerofaba carboxydovora]UMZ73017.1 hypothetical protein ACONDI_00561 [Natranaerofaba carboxydovora]
MSLKDIYNDLKFEVLHKDKVVAEVFVSADKKYIYIDQTTKPEKRPFPVSIDTKTTPFNNPRRGLKVVNNFLKSRCFPKERFNCHQLLEDLGLKTYSPLAIVEKTHGLQFDDYLWIRFNGEDLKYDDIKIRD